MTEIYLHIVARMADYMDTHPYMSINVECADILAGDLAKSGARRTD